ncbi:MAG: hypothetical protein AAGG38_14875 [Planctomycetota bacterium]
MTDALFPLNDDDLLAAAYARQDRTLDDLPYTPEFEALYVSMYGPDGRDAPPTAGQPEQTRAHVFRRLQNLRKAGKLPKLGRAKAPPPRIQPDQEAQLVQLVEAQLGQLSKRDQLPYQPGFDHLADRFNAATGLSLSRHDLWRIIAKLAK